MVDTGQRTGGLMPADDVKQEGVLRGGRQRANNIEVHRIELGAWERKRLESVMPALTIQQYAKPFGNLLIAGSLSAIAIGGYLSLKHLYGWASEMGDDVEGIWEAIVGKKTYTDADGNEYINALAVVPVLGSLAGSGINIVIATKDSNVAKAYRNNFGFGSLLELVGLD